VRTRPPTVKASKGCEETGVGRAAPPSERSVTRADSELTDGNLVVFLMVRFI
jgi:hypothetical protein